MFYEYQCVDCDRSIVVNKLMEESDGEELCPYCEKVLHREFSVPYIHMGRMVAEGFERTSEPPEELKPKNYTGKLRDQVERIPHMVSYPNRSTKRKKGMVQ